MSSGNEQSFLQDIREAIRRIQSYTADTDYDEFHVDIKTQDAVMRNLEIIGEDTKLPIFLGAISVGCAINLSITTLGSILILSGTLSKMICRH